MASILRYKQTKWRAFVRVNGQKVAKVFETKTEAVEWAQAVEKRGKDPGRFLGETLSELLEVYAKNETPKKRGSAEEDRRIRALQKEPIASLTVAAITPEILQSWVDDKKQHVSIHTGRKLKTSSVARYLTILKAVFSYAVKTKRIESSPAALVNCPVEEEPRERIASEQEIEALKTAAQWSEDEVPTFLSQRLVAAFIFACYTGMRIGEIEKLERSWIIGNTIKIPKEATKTLHGRTIAVPDRAIKILQLVCSQEHHPGVFGIRKNQHDALFRKIRSAAGLDAVYDSEGREIVQSLHFHDSRATFCTWAASPGPDGAPRLDVLALAKQTGHKNLKMLMRYYRKDPTELLNRLNS